MQKRIKYWGWGYEDEPETPPQLISNMERYFGGFFGVSDFNTLPVPPISAARLRKPRISIPERLKAFCTSDHDERVRHAVGRSFLDYVNIFSNEYSNPPDVVAFVRSEQDIIEVLDWATGANAAVIPFGGGTSVTGGVEPIVGEEYDAVITIDTTRLNKVLEVDDVSQCARIQAGAFGPHLEAQLRPRGYSLRHYPQSFQHSTLGGWIATRSGGHFATQYTHIDDFVESLRVVTPTGTIETRRMPGDGAGPDPDRLFLGAEGSLGIITEAWMRIQKRATHRASIAVFFGDFLKGCEAVRVISQAGLFPSNLRIIDAEEARVNYVSNKNKHILFLGFESADHPVQAWMNRALEICADHGGEFDREILDQPNSHRESEQGRWRDIFLETSYYREITTPREIIYGTMETSITWDRFPELYRRVMDVTAQSMEEATGKRGSLSCRFVYTYPDGPAPYWSFYCLGNHGKLKEQWKHVKKAATDEFIAYGGSATHHTSIGRDHMTWLNRQTDRGFSRALRSVKSALDPKWIMNPGVIVPVDKSAA
ncbi:MAG: FAD-binding oxidoreductase [Hyphomicrobiaceae bacterium]|nr:FAD-binding oxidoreductase [Hyphomicrobiaceae bacterium]